jgi:hypothetical protein
LEEIGKLKGCMLLFVMFLVLGIGLVSVLLSFEKSTNTNTIPAYVMVFLVEIRELFLKIFILISRIRSPLLFLAVPDFCFLPKIVLEF